MMMTCTKKSQFDLRLVGSSASARAVVGAVSVAAADAAGTISAVVGAVAVGAAAAVSETASAAAAASAPSLGSSSRVQNCP